MKKLSVAVALAAIAVAVPLSIGSSHREAPLTSLDPSADDTDVYAYTANDAQDALTVVANWIPFEDPAGGPNFYRFDDRARYYINIDNTGDGKPDIRYRFKFKTKVLNPNSFLYAGPQVTSIDDPDLNVQQTYDIIREGKSDARDSRKGKHRKAKRGERKHAKRKYTRNRSHRRKARRSDDDGGSRVIARNLPVAPNNVGPKTIPDYNAVAAQAIKELSNGTKVFAGQRDDPFFVDLGTTFDSINFRDDTGATGGGKDDLAGYGVHSIVMQIPEQLVTRDGRKVSSDKDDDAVVGVWASTERKRVQVLGSDDNDDDGTRNGGYVQVSRLGNPLVNEVVIPLGKKDQFNRTTPDKDAQYANFVLNPELARLMNALFGLGVKETDRTDIVLALLQGVPGLNQQTGKPVDTIKLNLGTDPSSSPSRFGVLGGDTAGFPNGRRLTDDVVDIELRVVAGALIGKDVKLGDGVDQNDKSFSSTFPYLAAPDSGFNSALKRTEGSHPPQ
jgi:Domain of unknown function (DUF4331)